LAIGPNDLAEFQRFWKNENIPFIGPPDPEHKVARLYKQEVNLFKWGRMPLNCVLDAKGDIRYSHYGNSMSNIPANETLLDVIDKLNATSV
jgi:peroxiredoxin